MTDKQIIKKFSDNHCLVLENNQISLRENEFTAYRIVLGKSTNELLEFVKDTYLHLKAKEQECEELKKIIDEAKNSKLDLKSFLVGEAIQNEYEQQLDQLKAENEKYQLFIEKLCDYTGLECDNEEQAMRTLSDFASQMNKARWRIDRYKQTLTEIKEIAEEIVKGTHFTDDIEGHLKELTTQILQKISEVE